MIWSDEVLLAARVLLALVFAAAAVGKLLDAGGSRAALRAFGIPERVADVAAPSLPAVELAIAAALLPASSAVPAAAAAGCLLVVFTAAVVANLVRGRRPDCHCFGRLHAAPIGWPTVARNAVLIAAAGVVVSAPGGAGGPSALAWLGDLGTAAAVAVGAAAVLTTAAALLVYEMLRRHGRLLLRVEALEATLEAHGIPLPGAAPAAGVFVQALPPGTPAPGFALSGVDGVPVSLQDLLGPGKPALLVFATPGCQPCRDLLPRVADWQRRHGERLTLAVMSAGDAEANRALAGEHGVERVLLQPDRAVAEAFGITATPSAVLVAADGTIASAVGQGGAAIERLVEQVVRPPVLQLTRVTGTATARVAEARGA